MTKYDYPSVLLVPSGSMHSPAKEITNDYVCPEGGMDGHGIQSPLYLDPRTGDTFVYCPIHRIIYRLRDNLKVRFQNITWKPVSRESNRLRAPTKSGGTRKIQQSSMSTLDIE